MSTLSNCIELFYKGLIQASGVSYPDSLMNESHSLVRLTEFIEAKIMPLSAPMSKRQEYERRDFLRSLQDMYIDARYGSVDVSFSDFCICYEWAEKQYTLIRETLIPTYTHITSNSIEHSNSIERDDW